MTVLIAAARRKALRAAAHRLKPGVIVGKGGLTEPLLDEIRRGLRAEGLIKVRFTVKEGQQIDALCMEIDRRLGCACLGRTGFVAVFFDPETCKIADSAASRRAGITGGIPEAPDRQ